MDVSPKQVRETINMRATMDKIKDSFVLHYETYHIEYTIHRCISKRQENEVLRMFRNRIITKILWSIIIIYRIRLIGEKVLCPF